jgi:hypothetical protein
MTSLLAAIVLAMVAPATPAKATLVVGEGLEEPFGVDFDAAGNMYVVEMAGNRVSVLDKQGALRVLAGTGEAGLGGDGGPAAAPASVGRTTLPWDRTARSTWPIPETTASEESISTPAS